MDNVANFYGSHGSLKPTSTPPSQGHKNHIWGLSPAPCPLCPRSLTSASFPSTCTMLPLAQLQGQKPCSTRNQQGCP